MGVADDLDPAANHDSADNQSKDQVRKSGLAERHKDTAKHCSEIGQSVVFREYPASESASSAVDCANQPIATSSRNIEALIAKNATSSLDWILCGGSGR
jgi:hypothetical protein